MILKIIQLVKHFLKKTKCIKRNKKDRKKKKRLINGQKILLNLFDDLVEAVINNNNKIANEDDNKVLNEDNNKTVKEDNNKIVNEDNNKIVNEDNNVNDDDNNNDDSDDNDDDDNDDITVKEIIISKRSMKQNHLKNKQTY